MSTSKISITDFIFRFSGYGHYAVAYTSPTSGDTWINTTNDMPLIDATRNSSSPKVKDLEALKRICKQGKKIKQ